MTPFFRKRRVSCTGTTSSIVGLSYRITSNFPRLGSIIRCLRRLEELLREMVNAAKAIGDAALEEKFEAARAALKRDIVFSASLYL